LIEGCGVCISERREEVRKLVKEGEYGKGGWIQCKYFVYIYVNGKMISVETIPIMGEWDNEGEWWRG
jgi:hypothetical protein